MMVSVCSAVPLIGECSEIKGHVRSLLKIGLLHSCKYFPASKYRKRELSESLERV